MHTRILQVGVGIRDMIQTVPPIHFEAAPPPEITDCSDSRARQPLRRRGDYLGVPSPAVIEKWDQVQEFFPNRRPVHRNTGLEGSQKNVVPKQRELPIASHAV